MFPNLTLYNSIKGDPWLASRLLFKFSIISNFQHNSFILVPWGVDETLLWVKYCCYATDEVVVVVVVVVYLTTNQRHMGYLSSGNGHLAGRYSTPLGPREPTPLGVQGRPVTISQNKPKAIIKHCAPDAFLFSDPI